MTIKQHVGDIVVKAAKTFVEAAVPLWAATNFSFGKDAVLSAAAAGISAVWNFAVKLETSYQTSQTVQPAAANPNPTTSTTVVMQPDTSKPKPPLVQ
jgi:hypothetical protein